MLYRCVNYMRRQLNRQGAQKIKEFVKGMRDASAPSIKKLYAFLPEDIYIAADTDYNIYNKNVCFCGNIQDYHFEWICPRGKNLKDRIHIDTSQTGDFLLQLLIYDSRFIKKVHLKCRLHIISSKLKNSIKICPIGDSLTNGKPWLERMREMSGDKIEFVGTLGKAPLCHEGRSGYTASMYLTKNYYSGKQYGTKDEEVHAFFNPVNNRFDWKNYLKTNNIKPDCVIIFLGTNGISMSTFGGFGKNIQINGIRKMVQCIRKDESSIPIIIAAPPFYGDQNGLGNQLCVDGYKGRITFKYYIDKCIFNLMLQLYCICKKEKNVFFAPIALTHDSENNFRKEVKRINSYSEDGEPVCVEAVHPMKEGYMQMADNIFGTVCGVFNSTS